MTPPRIAIAVVAAIVLVSGCSRAFWRRQADRDAHKVLDATRSDARWAVPRTTVEPDPRSRFADPFDPDRGPLPPDDPTAHAAMHRAGPWDGYEWRKLGRAPSIENPDWLAPYGLPAAERFGGRVIVASYPGEDPPGRITLGGTIAKAPDPACNPHAVATPADLLPEALPPIDDLTLVGAIDLAQIHNRDYQTAIEDVYLTALALTFERFQFGVRYLGFGGEPTTSATYQALPNAQDRVVTDKRFGVSQLLPTGGQWVVEFLNDTIYLVSAGPGATTSSSSLAFQFVQPLLFGAGRRVVLAGLTQAERDVLYAVRDLARFRRTFFVDLVAAGPAGGFLGLLNDVQVLRNQADNIRRIEEQLVRLRVVSSEGGTITEPLDGSLEGFVVPPEFAGRLAYDPDLDRLEFLGELGEDEVEPLIGLVDDESYRRAATKLAKRVRLAAEVLTLEVAQLENSLASARQSLASSRAAFADSLDAYKIFLGLPPDMPVTLDDGLLGQFELIDPRLIGLEAELDAIDLTGVAGGGLRDTVDRLATLRDRVGVEGVASVEADVERVRERLAGFDAGDPRAVRLRPDLARDEALLEVIVEDFETASDQLVAISARLPADATPLDAAGDDLVFSVGSLRENLLQVVRNLTVLQVDARVEAIDLEPFDLTLEEVTANALANRLDLKNARAEVTDARRDVEVAANALEAVLDVVTTGTLNTQPGNRPLDFRLDQSRLDVGLSFTAPLDQIAERNTYRAALIAYQRERREYMLFEDAVKAQVRSEWRQLQVLRTNFEIARRAVRFAAVQLVQAIADGEDPANAGNANRRGSQGLNLLNAFDAVLDTQNSLIGIWTDYETNRLLIHQDMGIMRIDERGLWDDPFYAGAAASESAEPVPTLPPLPSSAYRIESPADEFAPVAADDRAAGRGPAAEADVGRAGLDPGRADPRPVDRVSSPEPEDASAARGGGGRRRDLAGRGRRGLDGR